MQPDLLDAVLNQWPDALSGHLSLEVGLSGGVDSVVLLDVLARCREHRPLTLSAVHVHHGFSANADDWVRHCEALCARLCVALRVCRVKVMLGGGLSLEAEARKERYQVYRASAAEVIALAHHADDQAETVMLQVLRGGGVKALSGMAGLREWEGHRLWRPLLGVSRDEIMAYARWRGLAWIEDESNADVRWRRNFLRHDVMPVISRHIPAYRRHLARSALLMADAAAIVGEVAQADLARCLAEGRLRLGAMAELSAARQRMVLAAWFESSGLSALAPDALEAFRQQLLHAGEDRSPCLRVDGITLFRYRSELWRVRLPETLPASVALEWPAGSQSPAGWAGTLVWRRRPGGIASAVLERGVQLVPRQGGERIGLAVGQKRVKTILQEQGVPPALRPFWPLLQGADGQLLAVPGCVVAAQVAEADGWWPDWSPDGSLDS